METLDTNQTKIENEIMREYEQSLVIPTRQPHRELFILCPVGIIGAGKTTVLKPLAQKLSLVRISSDEIRKRLKEHGLGYEAVVRIGSELSRKYFARGYSEALDSDAASPRSKSVIENAEREFGTVPIWIHINPPKEFILHKLHTHKHTWLFKDANEVIANYRKRKALHKHLNMPFIYTFDTSRDNLSIQIDEAAELIRNAVKILED